MNIVMLGVCRTVELAVLGTESDVEESDLDTCLEDDPQGLDTCLEDDPQGLDTCLVDDPQGLDTCLDTCLEDEPQGVSVSDAVCTLHLLLGDGYMYILVCRQVTQCRHQCHSHCMQLGGLTKYSILPKLACEAF